MVHKKDLGKMGEAMIIRQALQRGCSTFVEFGDNSKIDLIIEDGDKKLHRVQVKVVSRLASTPDVTPVYLYKSGPNYQFKYSDKDFDWFAIIDAATEQVAWVPSSVCNDMSACMNLRHAPPKSHQKANIRMFAEYTTFPFTGSIAQSAE